MNLSYADQIFLNEASDFLSEPGFIVRSLAWAGKPLENLSHRLPEQAKQIISVATKKAVEKALVAAVETIPRGGDQRQQLTVQQKSQVSSWVHKSSTTFTGAFSGFFGLPALPFELPVTTVLILRGILDQARLYGHDLDDLETRLEGLMIFTLGTESKDDDSIDSAYLLARAAHAQLIRQAADYAAKISSKQLADIVAQGASPVLSRLIAEIAKSFQIRVSQKMMSKIVPVVGAASGGALNYAFTDFYCSAAKYHFGIRALEKKYGMELVQGLMRERIRFRKTSAENRA